MNPARNHTGHRVGEHHQKAKLTDKEVRAMRADHRTGMGYKRLAAKYGCGVSTARDVCRYWTRAGA